METKTAPLIISRKWVLRIWKRHRRNDTVQRAMPAKPRDLDAELAELAALIESGDSSPEALERVAKLISGTDSKL